MTTGKTLAKIGHNAAKWIDSRKKVSVGDQIKITATGTISVQNQSAKIHPNGKRTSDGQQGNPPDANYVASNLPMHALIGVISESQPSFKAEGAFFVGSEVIHTAKKDGNLYFIVNDNKGFFHDNTGQFTVFIEILPSKDAADPFPAHDLHEDQLTILIGIDDFIQTLLNDYGIFTLEHIIDANDDLQHILEENGKFLDEHYQQKIDIDFLIHRVALSWPRQAMSAVEGNQDEFNKIKSEIEPRLGQ